MSLIAATGDFNALAVGVFACVLAVTLVITRWAAKRTHSATEFYAAGRGVSGRANGVATAGDYLSASTFLGYAGLMYLYGFDGWIIGLGALLSFLPVLYLLAGGCATPASSPSPTCSRSACASGPCAWPRRSTRC